LSFFRFFATPQVTSLDTPRVQYVIDDDDTLETFQVILIRCSGQGSAFWGLWRWNL